MASLKSVLSGLVLVQLVGGTAFAAASFSRKPYAQNVTRAQVVLRWIQSSGGATVTYHAAGGATQTVNEPASTTGEHEITLTGLQSSARYTYTVDLGGGVTATGELTTAVLPDEPFTFVVYGDDRSNTADHQSVVDAIAKESADFLINTGDVVVSSSTSYYTTFFTVEAALLSQNVLFTTLGNHEADFVSVWAQQFANPTTTSGTERYYSFDFGNSRFVVLDFNASTTAQKTWLGTTLADARTQGLTHIFIILHHSPYDSGTHGENTTAQTDWVPLFSQYHVDLLLAGHDHDYERGYNATTDLRYVVTGGGGAPLYTTNSKKAYQQKFQSTLHYVKVAVTGPNVAVTATTPAGAVIDTFAFSTGPGPGQPDAGPPGPGQPDAGAGPGPGQPDAGTGPGEDGSSAGGCQVAAGSTGSGAAGLLALALALVATGVRRRRR